MVAGVTSHVFNRQNSVSPMRGRGRRICDDPAYRDAGSRASPPPRVPEEDSFEAQLEEAKRLSLMDLCRETIDVDEEDSDQAAGVDAKEKLADELRAVISQPKLLRQILGELPGVDPFDPRFARFAMSL